MPLAQDPALPPSDRLPRLTTEFAPEPASRAAAAPAALGGSRRLRLWELETAAFCPLIGVCLPLPALRRLAERAEGGAALPADDFELHARAVQACQRRTALAEALQRELDTRFATEVRRSRELRDAAALAEAWQAALSGVGWPGQLWATLGHPMASPSLRRRVLNDVHMRQHQLGAAQREEQARIEALQQAEVRLRDACESLQQRLQAAAAAQARREERLQAQLVCLRAQAVVRETLLQAARDELLALRGRADELPQRAALAAEVHDQAERIAALQRELAREREAGQRQRRRADALAAAMPRPPEPAPPPAPAPGAMPTLAERAVLCVGGRTASVPLYRALVEGSGGRFLHHDGGAEQGPERLEATLSAADLVICQAACISHDAYWRVKEHCKRHGKRCVFVDNTGSATLKRAIDQLCA